MTTHLNLLADEPGEYPGFSANFSGDGFSDMRFTVTAVPAGDFDGWVAQSARRGSGARRPPAMPRWQSRAGRAADDLSLGRPEAVRAHRRPDARIPKRRMPVPRGARRRQVGG